MMASLREAAPATFYERHLLFDKAIDPRSATPRDQFEAFAPLGEGRARAPLGAYHGNLRARELQARMLADDGVPDWTLAREQRPMLVTEAR